MEDSLDAIYEDLALMTIKYAAMKRQSANLEKRVKKQRAQITELNIVITDLKSELAAMAKEAEKVFRALACVETI